MTHVFYEAPHRILDTLADVEAVFGASQHVVIARELTKLHEEFLRGAVAELRGATCCAGECSRRDGADVRRRLQSEALPKRERALPSRSRL